MFFHVHDILYIKANMVSVCLSVLQGKGKAGQGEQGRDRAGQGQGKAAINFQLR